MKNIKASIVTVCFNSAKTIEQAMQSIFGQNYENIEYIVIDGGSTDGTVDIIKKYESDIDYWVSEPDHGIFDAMNKGIAKATGDIIGFMNSDDWYAEGAIAAIVEAFGRTNADVVYGHTVIVDHEVQRFRPMRSLDYMLYGMVFGHQASFVKTCLMKENLFDTTFRTVADYAFFLEMYLQGKRFFEIDTTIAFFRAGGNCYHPWKGAHETKRASLRLCKGRIDEGRYRKLKEDFQEKSFFPAFRFLSSRFERLPIRSEELIQLLRDRHFVLWGAGQLGQEVLTMMNKLGLPVSAFWDGDAEKQGTEKDGVPILCPYQKKHQGKDITILITTIHSNEEITQKLEKLCYERDKDFFSKEEWLRWMAGAWLGRCE